MSIPVKMYVFAVVWRQWFAAAWAMLVLGSFLLPFALPWQSAAILAVLSLVTGLCYLVVGLGGPKRAWMPTLFGVLWAVGGMVHLGSTLLSRL